MDQDQDQDHSYQSLASITTDVPTTKDHTTEHGSSQILTHRIPPTWIRLSIMLTLLIGLGWVGIEILVLKTPLARATDTSKYNTTLTFSGLHACVTGQCMNPSVSLDLFYCRATQVQLWIAFTLICTSLGRFARTWNSTEFKPPLIDGCIVISILMSAIFVMLSPWSWQVCMNTASQFAGISLTIMIVPWLLMTICIFAPMIVMIAQHSSYKPTTPIAHQGCVTAEARV